MMDERQSTLSPKQKAQVIWQRLCGCFGADAVERKFGPTAPPEWVAMISRLKDHEIERGVRRLLNSGAATVPSLPAFVKLCRAIGDDADDTPRPLALPKPDNWQGDKWDIAASRHLLAHIMREIRANPRKYGRPASYVAMRTMSREQFPNADASPEFIAAVQTLVGFKNAWAQDMREWLDPETGEIGRPPVDVQQAAWADCMQRAEAAIAKQRRTAA